MSDNPKGYIVITAVAGGGASPGVNAQAIVVSADNTSVEYFPAIIFAYGDSNQAIRQLLVSELQSLSGISNLDVNFLP